MTWLLCLVVDSLAPRHVMDVGKTFPGVATSMCHQSAGRCRQKTCNAGACSFHHLGLHGQPHRPSELLIWLACLFGSGRQVFLCLFLKLLHSCVPDWSFAEHCGVFKNVVPMPHCVGKAGSVLWRQCIFVNFECGGLGVLLPHCLSVSQNGSQMRSWQRACEREREREREKRKLCVCAWPVHVDVKKRETTSTCVCIHHLANSLP